MLSKERRSSQGGDAVKKLREKYGKAAQRQSGGPLSVLTQTSPNFRPIEPPSAVPNSSERSMKSFFADAKDTKPFFDKENVSSESSLHHSAMPSVGRPFESPRLMPGVGSRHSFPLPPSTRLIDSPGRQSECMTDLSISKYGNEKMFEELRHKKDYLEKELVSLQASGRRFGDSPRKPQREEDQKQELQRLSRELAEKTTQYDQLMRQNQDSEQKVSALLELVFTLQKELRHIKELNLKELTSYTV